MTCRKPSPGKHLCHQTAGLSLSWRLVAFLHQNHMQTHTTYSIRTHALCEGVRESSFHSQQSTSIKPQSPLRPGLQLQDQEQASRGMSGRRRQQIQKREKTSEMRNPRLCRRMGGGRQSWAPYAATPEQAAEAAEEGRPL